MFFVFFSSLAVAQDFYGLLNNIFDQPGLSRLNLADLQQSRIKLSTAYVYEDYYRVKTAGIASQSLSGDASMFTVYAVNSARNIKYGLFSRINEHREHFSNIDADLSVNTEYSHTARDLALHLALGTKTILWGVGLDKQSILLKAPILINKFPESEDSQMNRYFLDWLEPSFGNELNVMGEYEMSGLQTYITIVLPHELMMNLHYRISSGDLDPRLEYINSSNYTALQGDREMIFDLAIVNQSLEIGLEGPGWVLNPTLSFQNSHADLTIENPLPPLPTGDYVDFREYGWLEFSRKGGSLSMAYLGRSLQLESGIGYSRWEANTELKTPVLGRSWFFPISHAAQLNISGHSYSQQLKLEKEYVHEETRLAIKTGYQHAYFDLRAVGEAELEFNISTVPIDYPYQFHLHTLSFGFPISYAFKAFTLQYEFNQIIPWFERVDDSELSLQGEGAGLDKKVRGGGQHMLSLIYQWE